MYCICFIWILLDLKPEAWQQLMYSSPEKEGTFFYTSKRLELWSWEDYKLDQLLLPRVVDFSSPLQCTDTRIRCFKPEKVQKRKGLRWILAKNAMSLKRTDRFCTVSWGSKAYIITFGECVSLLVLPLFGHHQFDTKGDVSKISHSRKFNGNWDLRSELITYQTIGNLYKKEML